MLKQTGFLKRSSQLKSIKSLNKGTSTLKQGGRLNFRAPARDIFVEGVQIISDAEADTKMSAFVIARDQKCLKCGSPDFLTCSHYHGRTHSATRFDPLNLITLCVWCHTVWEADKEGEYKLFMIDLIGQHAFELLAIRAKSKMKRIDALEEAMRFFSTTKQLSISNI